MACPTCMMGLGATEEQLPDWAYNLPGGAPVEEDDAWYLKVNWDALFKSGLYVYDEVAKRYATAQAATWAQRGFGRPTESLMNNPLTWLFVGGLILILVLRK